MPERFERYLKLTCLALGALLLYQAVRVATAPDPLASPRTLPIPATQAASDEETAGNPSGLPLSVRQRVDGITQSEIFGPVPQPPPMALLGIGGDDVLLRAPNGQTDLIREGEELGGVKLIRIGINRVLIEHEGRLEELTLFSGLGSDSLMPASTPNEKAAP